MTETILLAIFAALSAVLIYFGRRWYNDHKAVALSSRAESVARLVLVGIFALVAHLVWYRNYQRVQFWVAVGFNALVLYALSHLADRWASDGRL